MFYSAMLVALLGPLGSPKYADRARSAVALEGAWPASALALAIGQRAADPEVADASRRLAERLTERDLWAQVETAHTKLVGFTAPAIPNAYGYCQPPAGAQEWLENDSGLPDAALVRLAWKVEQALKEGGKYLYGGPLPPYEKRSGWRGEACHSIVYNIWFDHLYNR